MQFCHKKTIWILRLSASISEIQSIKIKKKIEICHKLKKQMLNAENVENMTVPQHHLYIFFIFQHSAYQEWRYLAQTPIENFVVKLCGESPVSFRSRKFRITL